MSVTPLIWFKGNSIPAEDAVIPVLSPTAQFGLNVFEGLRGYSNSSGQLFIQVAGPFAQIISIVSFTRNTESLFRSNRGGNYYNHSIK